jgi:hypothetical protein
MNMVDRAAVAMMARGGELWAGTTELRGDHYRSEVRAVIEDVMFPTEEMIEAGVGVSQRLTAKTGVCGTESSPHNINPKTRPILC